MPTTGVQVLQVLTRQHAVLRQYSELTRILVTAAGTDDPVIHAGETVVDAAGTSRRAAKVGIGLGIVSSIVKALGADADIELSASSASSVEFGYDDVVSDRVDLATLDSWLARADFRPDLRNVTQLLVAEDVYVVIATLKARALSVRVLDSHDNGVAVDVPAIQAAVGARVSVAASGQRSHQLTFRGATALTVAVKAAQLKFDENGFWVNERIVSGVELREIPGFDANGISYLDVREIRLGEN